MSACPDRAARGERGLALVLTLLVLVLLVTSILEFDRSTRTAMKAAGNFRDGMKAFHLAASGVAAAQAVLKDDMIKTRIDDLTELWATSYPPYPVGDGTVALAIQDEGGKIYINGLITNTGKIREEGRKQLQQLFELKGLDPSLVDAIADWLDWDGIPEPRGAEDAYYQGLDHPYACRNARIETLSELHLVKGITDEVYRAISPYLTVYPNPQGGVEHRINVNTADPFVLQTIPYTENGVTQTLLTAEEAENIAAARPFSKVVPEVNNVPGVDAAKISKIASQLAVTSQAFSIYSEGEANGVKKSVIAVAERVGDVKLRYWRPGE